MKLSQLLDDKYLPRRLRGKSASTVRLHRIALMHFARMLGRDATLDDLTNDNLEKYLYYLSDRCNQAPATVNGNRAKLCSLWRFARDENLVSVLPVIPPEKEPIRVPTAWRVTELHAIFSEVAKMQGEIGKVPARLWWRTLIVLCLETGERIGALRSLKWSWIDGDSITIPAEARKGGKADKQYQVSPGTVELIRQVRSYGSPEPFPWPYCDLYLWQKFQKILKAAGLPCGRRDKFHRLRRTCASVVYAAGLDASDAMGHASRATTLKYLDPRFSPDIRPASLLQDYLSGRTSRNSSSQENHKGRKRNH